MFKAAFCLVLMAAPALADLIGIPTYQYFYTCASGEVDCIGFNKNQNNFGDFGMNGVVPTNWPPGVLTSGLRVSISNQHGQVLGKADSVSGGALSYGFGGQVTCLGGFCNDQDWLAQGINDNGLYVFATLFEGGCVGKGFTGVGALSPSCGAGAPSVLNLLNFDGTTISSGTPLGINDENRILIHYRLVGGLDVTGVLSPTEIPEPFNFVLAATGIGMLILAWRLRAGLINR